MFLVAMHIVVVKIDLLSLCRTQVRVVCGGSEIFGYTIPTPNHFGWMF